MQTMQTMHRPNNVLVTFAPQAGQHAPAHYRVIARYNYVDCEGDGYDVTAPAREVWSGPRGGWRRYHYEPDVPALIAAVAAVLGRIGYPVPVQYNGCEMLGIPANWTRTPLTWAQFARVLQ